MRGDTDVRVIFGLCRTVPHLRRASRQTVCPVRRRSSWVNRPLPRAPQTLGPWMCCPISVFEHLEEVLCVLDVTQTLLLRRSPLANQLRAQRRPSANQAQTNRKPSADHARTKHAQSAHQVHTKHRPSANQIWTKSSTSVNNVETKCIPIAYQLYSRQCAATCCLV